MLQPWATAIDRRQSTRTVRRNEPPAQRPDPNRPAGTDLLPQIRHIVILMMENHSFDNYLGTLGRGDGLPTDASGRPTAVNSGVPAHHLISPAQVAGAPVQSWQACHTQYDDGACDGFVRSVDEARPNNPGREIPMGYWTAAELPFYSALASTFPLADRWFSSCLGPTFPNRRFLISGTANGLIDDMVVNLVDTPPAGTIFDLLGHHGISWANYYPGSALGQAAKRVLGSAGLAMTRQISRAVLRLLSPWLDLLGGGLTFTADLYPTGLARVLAHLHDHDQFFADAAAGTLPAVSIVDPDFRRYSEENPQDIQLGESFAADVINAVTHGPGWPNTLLLWLYDEHGGYYDHVPPPPAPAPDDVEGHDRLQLPGWVRGLLRPLFGSTLDANADPVDPHFDRLGFRVPAVVVSPYARTETVSSTVFDHTSVLRLIAEKWNLPPLTRRDAAANSPLDMLDLEAEPAFLTPPALPEAALGPGAWRR